MCNTIGNIFRLGIIGGICLALAMQFFVTFGCSFITTADGNNIGIWYIDDGSGTCVEWPDTREEIVAGAQSALTLSTIAGFAAGALILFEWLCCEICCAGCVEGLAICAAWMMGGAVFMIYGIQECGDFENSAETGTTSTNECVWAADSSFMTVACIMYLICGVVLCCAPQPDPICR